MKIILLLFVLAPFILAAQVIDSTVVAREVDSLVQVCRKLTDGRKFEEALKVIDAAEKKTEDSFGKASSRYGDCVFNHGRIFYRMRRYNEAEPFFREAKAIWEKALGKEHPSYASHLDDLGVLYNRMRRHEFAEILFLESIAIREKILGKEHPAYTSSLNNLANLYLAIGRYEDAERLYIEAKTIREKSLGKEHLDYASSLNNIGVLYKEMGRYEDAELLFFGAKDIREKVLGKEDLDYASTLNNLGVLYKGMGQYGAAEKLYLEVKVIREKVLGKEHPDYASILNNLANLYLAMGLNEDAERLHIEAKFIREKVLGKEDLDYASSLNNLGVLYKAMGRYEDAEILYLEVKAIREKVLGKEHPDYASILGNLGILYKKLGRYESAESLYIEANAIRKKTLGKEHPLYASGLTNLANLYDDLGRYKIAESLYLKADTIWKEVLDIDSPEYQGSLNNLGNIYWELDQVDLACEYYMEANMLQRNHLNNATHHLSEIELSSFTSLFIENTNNFFSFSQKYFSRFTDLVRVSYDNALFHKGFLLNVVSRTRNLALADSAATQKYYLLKSYYRRLAKEYDKPVSDRKGVADLEEKANALEKDLTRTVTGYSEATRQISWQIVQAALKPGEAAMEFVDYNFSNPKPTDSIVYSALLLRPGDTQPLFIPLFEEKQLKKLLALVDTNKQNINTLYTGEITDPDLRDSLKTLYQLIWQPLEPYLKNIEQVWYSPSGELHRIAFAAIEDSTGRPISDNLRLHLLGSTRELVFRDDEENVPVKSALLFGDITYGADNVALHAVVKKGCPAFSPTNRSAEAAFGASRSGKRTAVATEPLDPLPATRVEITAAIKQLRQLGLSPVAIAGADATEEAFKCHARYGEPSPDLIVVATHGEFLPDPMSDTAPYFYDDYRARQNPMFRSRLAFAGADKYRLTGSGYDSLENGVLTAYEVAGLNLSNTKLAVLSACETGLGKVSGAEGVYGLQRAFKIAGTDYLLMSLWEVPSAATTELMTTFYDHWLNEKLPLREAFYQAQQDMKSRGKSAYEWAGFVLFK